MRYRKVSKARDRMLKGSYRLVFWQAHRQQCCRVACQILRFPLLRDFAISYNKTSYWILKQDQGGSVLISRLEMFSINSRDHDLIFLTTSRHGYASTLLALCGDSSTQVDSPHIMFRLFVLNHMMTSSNGNIFRVTGHFCGEFTGPRWLPRTKASDAKLWWFLWSASE